LVMSMPWFCSTVLVRPVAQRLIPKAEGRPDSLTYGKVCRYTSEQ
jgi:hypothetical protein